MQATGGHTMVTTAEAGAGSTGVSLAPSIAIALSNVDRVARVEAGAAALTISGNLTVLASAPPLGMSATTTATGSATSTGGSAAAGISLALTIANHRVSAITNRSVNASGDVAIIAI